MGDPQPVPQQWAALGRLADRVVGYAGESLELGSESVSMGCRRRHTDPPGHSVSTCIRTAVGSWHRGSRASSGDPQLTGPPAPWVMSGGPPTGARRVREGLVPLRAGGRCRSAGLAWVGGEGWGIRSLDACSTWRISAPGKLRGFTFLWQRLQLSQDSNTTNEVKLCHKGEACL